MINNSLASAVICPPNTKKMMRYEAKSVVSLQRKWAGLSIGQEVEGEFQFFCNCELIPKPDLSHIPPQSPRTFAALTGYTADL